MANYLNNNQKTPSLFEEAMLGRVYDEPKDDDKNFIEKRYDYYKNGYLSFSPSEKRFAKEHMYLAAKFLINRSKAIKAVEPFDGKSNGYGDAIRHCYWCALNQMAAGYNSPLAEELGNAHEEKPKNNAKAMDLHNNSVGYQLGNQAIINGWSEDELLNQVINAANNGTLQIGL